MALLDYFTGGGIKRGSEDQIAAARQGLADYTGAINTARGDITSYGAKAAAPWEALQPGSVSAFQHYLNLTGAGGAAGYNIADVTKLASGYAQNEWQNYVDNAYKAAGFAPGIAQGASGVQTGI